jgi:hypothetical protein
MEKNDKELLILAGAAIVLVLFIYTLYLIFN